MKKHWLKYLFVFFLLILIPVILYNTIKPLPNGLSYEGKTYYVDNVEFLYDLTYQSDNGITVYEQEIFKEMDEIIRQAEEFIVVDMFLFNNYIKKDRGFPKLSSTLTEALIKQKNQNPSMQIVFITDPINTGYYSHQNELLKELEANDIDVVITNLTELRDSNPIYSGIWRICSKFLVRKAMAGYRTRCHQTLPM